jgi:branched-chain amino acid transport system permease protein
MILSRQTILVLALLAVALVAPFGIYPIFLMKGFCFALFAAAFNLLLGYVGLLSFGHAMFFGFSAYVTAHAAKVWGITPEIAILMGVAVATMMGAVTGWLAIRRSGIYFSMVTLAFSQMIYFVAVQAPFTHGEDGIQGVPRGHLFGLIDLSDTLSMYYFVLAVLVVALLFINRVVTSPFGQVLKAIRDNEPRAISLGYEVERYKLLAFTLSAGLAGLAGSVKALVFQLASLTDVHWHASGEVVLMTLLGGVGTIFGPAVGAFLVVAIQNYFSEVGSWVTIIQGAIFVVCVLLFRAGMVGVFVPWLKKRGIRA